MKATILRYARDQSGYTLVELVVASAIGLFVMTGLTSVVFTSWQSGVAATSRVEASGQIRSFQFYAYDDFALSGVPNISGCTLGGLPPCTITLSGTQASNAVTPVLANFAVTYAWDGITLDRQVVGGNSQHAATGVTAFSAYVAGTAPHQTVIVTLTVTVQSYAETQTLQFYPRVNP